MKSDDWLIEKIINESINKQDISYIKKLIQQGFSDEEVLMVLRKRMSLNSKGMRAYIRQEKIRALMLKLAYRIHWIYLLPVIKRWLREKEVLIRWRESNHHKKIDEKVNELKGKLVDKYNKVRVDCINTGEIPEDVMSLLEKTAEELLLQIEEETKQFNIKQNGKPPTKEEVVSCC